MKRGAKSGGRGKWPAPKAGLIEWFRPGEYERVETVLQDLRTLQVDELRTDQYVLDYARTFGIPAIAFRMSCIYGDHLMGTEDQGWVAHFLLRALAGKPIVIYGDGLQVRDVLYVNDLVDAFLLAQANIHTLSGHAFNIGGGLGNTTSLLELIDLIAAIRGEKPEIRLKGWRPGDQRYYVSDTRKFKTATGWAPKVCIRQGLERLYGWLLESRGLAVPQQLAASGAPYEIFAN